MGGGLTAAALASRLSGHAAVSVTCWDKAYEAGGRMTTHRHKNTQIDLGPQFITRKYGEEESIFKDLVASGVLKPLRIHSCDSFLYNTDEEQKDSGTNTTTKTFTVGVDDTIRLEEIDLNETRSTATSHLLKSDNYVAVNGSNTIVQHFWNKSGVQLRTKHFLDGLEQVGQQWVASSSAQGKVEKFDAVVFTQPVPQYITEESPEGRPQGNYLDILRKNDIIFPQLEKIRYYSSFSLGLFYDEAITLGLDWTVKYFPDNQILRYVCVDSVRRGKPHQPTSICIQTQRSWSENNLHLDKHAAGPLILSELKDKVGELPETTHVLPHRWMYSQTAVPYFGSPGAVTLNATPLLIGAGDSFAVSNVEGCLYSAKKAERLLTKWVDNYM